MGEKVSDSPIFRFTGSVLKRMHLPHKFQTRLVLTYLIISALVVVFLGIYADLILEKEAIDHLRSSLISQAQLSTQLVDVSQLATRDMDTLDRLAKQIKPIINARVTVIAPDGQVLGDSDEPRLALPQMENHLYRPEVRQASSGTIGSAIRYSDTLKQKMLYVAVPISKSKFQILNPNSKTPNSKTDSISEVSGIIRLAVPLQEVQELRWSIRQVILAGALISLLLSLIAGIFIARSITKPIKEINRISAQYTAGDFSKKIYVRSVDEINQLAETLNQFALQIQDKIALMQQEKNETLAILHSMLEGVIAVDKDTRIILFNPAVMQMLGVSAKDNIGRLLLETIRNNELYNITQQVLKTGESITVEIKIPRHFGVRSSDFGVFSVIGSPLLSGKDILGCVLVIHDITELRNLESVRKEFVANVSHELKTPLTAIKGYIETLLDGAIDDKENNRRFLTIIEEHSERLTRLIDDVLQLAELESKETAVMFEPVNLKLVVEEILPIFHRQCVNKNIQIQVNIPATISPVKADAEKLKEVFLNLLDNAIKFNVDNGKIVLTAQETDREIAVSITDTGIGIPEQALPRIFERFYRVDKTKSRELGGTGLGLSIVKHIIEQHNGTITVTSEPGKGSQFRFALPKR